MKKFLTVFIVMISLSVFSQQKEITGKVTDDTGQPVMGATLVIKGTNNGTVTNFDGEYTLKAKAGDVISFSFIGTETKNVTVANAAIINVMLKGSEQVLDEIVVVGYGKVKKSDLTGSVSSVKADDVTKSGTLAIDQALAGRVAGAVVTQNSGTPGAGASITIRGVSTISSSQPLYVIDGVPMENEGESGLNSEDQGSANLSPLSLINPSDIESIEILKDASASAIYGSRGANGVVLITTKSGVVGKGRLLFSQENSFGDMPNSLDLLDANEYWISRNESQINAGQDPISDTLLASAIAGELPSQDWLQVLLRTATSSNTNVSFSGGNKDIRYLLSTNLLNQTGLVKTTDFSRIQTRLNLDANISKKLKVGSRITYSVVDTDAQSTNTSNFENNGTSNVIKKALLSNPSEIYIPVNDQVDDDEEDQINPLTYVNNNTWESNLAQFLGNIYAELELSKSLSLKTTFTYQNRTTRQRFYQNNFENLGIILTNNRGGWARTSDAVNTSVTNTNELNYVKEFGEHTINLMLGQSQEWREAESIKTSNYGFANDLLTWHAPGTAMFFDPDQVSFIDSKLESFFGRFNYNFKNKLLLTLTGRYDGSSKFAENNKWAFFPAAALAYKLSNEKFIKEIDAINELKLRLSYGRVGNQAIREYQSLAQLESGQFVFGTDGESASSIYYSSQIPNPNLKWETTDQLDAGIDLGLFRNRITITADYYRKNTNDLLIANNKIAAQSGQDTFTQNFGEIETNGFEMSLGLRIIKKPKVSWSLDGNFSVGKAIIKNLITDNIQTGISFGRVSTGTQRLIIGEEIGTFYGWKLAGISQFNDFVEFQGLSNQEQIDLYNQNRTATYTYVDGYTGGRPVSATQNRPGEQLYEDLDNDFLISEADKKIIGQAQPDIMFGINNTFSFGNVDFSFFIDGQLGQEVANVTNWNLLTFASNQQLAVVKDAWTPENPSTTLPKVTNNDGWGNTLAFSDRYVEDASFIRLQNVSIGYNFSEDLLAKLKIDGLRVYASGSNLFTITDYSGFNPDVNLGGNNNLTLGHDNAGYPVTRTIRFGVSLKL